MVTNMVRKDVLRTDRQHKFYSGENNENINALYNILTTFALHHPSVGYCQVIFFFFFSFFGCWLLLTASLGSHGSRNSFFVNAIHSISVVIFQVKAYVSFTLSGHTLITSAYKVNSCSENVCSGNAN